MCCPPLLHIVGGTNIHKATLSHTDAPDVIYQVDGGALQVLVDLVHHAIIVGLDTVDNLERS